MVSKKIVKNNWPALTITSSPAACAIRMKPSKSFLPEKSYCPCFASWMFQATYLLKVKILKSVTYVGERVGEWGSEGVGGGVGGY